MHGNNLGISIKQHTKQYSKGEQLSPSAFAISRIPTCQKVSLWTKTELIALVRERDQRIAVDGIDLAEIHARLIVLRRCFGII